MFISSSIIQCLTGTIWQIFPYCAYELQDLHFKLYSFGNKFPGVINDFYKCHQSRCSCSLGVKGGGRHGSEEHHQCKRKVFPSTHKVNKQRWIHLLLNFNQKDSQLCSLWIPSSRLQGFITGTYQSNRCHPCCVGFSFFKCAFF